MRPFSLSWPSALVPPEVEPPLAQPVTYQDRLSSPQARDSTLPIPAVSLAAPFVPRPQEERGRLVTPAHHHDRQRPEGEVQNRRLPFPVIAVSCVSSDHLEAVSPALRSPNQFLQNPH